MPRMRIGKNAARGCCGCLTFGALVAACLFGVIYYVNSRPITVTVPPYPSVKNNAYPLFVKAGEMTERMKHPNPMDDPNITTFPAPLRNYALAYKESLPTLKLMESALKKPCICTDYRTLSNMSFGHFDSLRRLARVIGDDAEYLSRTGHPYEAVKLRLEGMEMGVMISNGGNLLSHLLGMAVEAVCRKDLERDIPNLTDSQLEYAEKRFQAIDRKRDPFSDIVKEEGNFAISSIIQILKLYRKQGEGEYVMMAVGLGVNSHSIPNSIHGFFQNKSDLLREKLKFFNALAQETTQPYHRPLYTKASTNIYFLVFNPDKYFGEAWKKYTINQSCDTIEQTEVALYWYRKKTGRFPKSLRELFPHYLASVPVDPFNQNKPLIYRLQPDGKGFLLYSVGPDQIDNGGKPMKSRRDKKGDLVAGYLNKW